MLHAVIGGSFRRRTSPSPLSSESPAAFAVVSPALPSVVAAHAGSLAAASSPADGDSAAALGSSAAPDADAGGGFGAAAPEQDTRAMIARLRKLDMCSPSPPTQPDRRLFAQRRHFCSRLHPPRCRVRQRQPLALAAPAVTAGLRARL